MIARIVAYWSMPRLVAYACLAVSAGFAARYGYTTRDGDAAYLAAAFWALAAIVGGCTPAWVCHHRDCGNHGRAWFTGVLGMLCFCVTVYGSVGGLAGSSDQRLAERIRATQTAKTDRAELERLTAERAKLEPRPIGTIEAELATARSSNSYRVSDSCTPEKIVGPTQRKVCEGFRDLEGELAGAQEAGRLEARIADISRRLGNGPAIAKADPGAAALSVLSGKPENEIAALSHLIAALALEMAGMVAMMRADSRPPPPRPTPSQSRGVDTAAASALATLPAPGVGTRGPAARIAPVLTERKPNALPASVPAAPPPGAVPRTMPIAAAGRVELQAPTCAAGVHGSVQLFSDTCLEKAPGERVEVGEILHRYHEYCSHLGKQPATDRSFGRRMRDQGHKFTIDEGALYALNVRLVDRT